MNPQNTTHFLCVINFFSTLSVLLFRGQDTAIAPAEWCTSWQAQSRTLFAIGILPRPSVLDTKGVPVGRRRAGKAARKSRLKTQRKRRGKAKDNPWICNWSLSEICSKHFGDKKHYLLRLYKWGASWFTKITWLGFLLREKNIFIKFRKLFGISEQAWRIPNTVNHGVATVSRDKARKIKTMCVIGFGSFTQFAAFGRNLKNPWTSVTAVPDCLLWIVDNTM